MKYNSDFLRFVATKDKFGTLDELIKQAESGTVIYGSEEWYILRLAQQIYDGERANITMAEICPNCYGCSNEGGLQTDAGTDAKECKCPNMVLNIGLNMTETHGIIKYIDHFNPSSHAIQASGA